MLLCHSCSALELAINAWELQCNASFQLDEEWLFKWLWLNSLNRFFSENLLHIILLFKDYLFLKVINDWIDSLVVGIILNILHVIFTFNMLTKIFVSDSADEAWFVMQFRQRSLNFIIFIFYNAFLLLIYAFSLCEFFGECNVMPLRQKSTDTLSESINTMEF